MAIDSYGRPVTGCFCGLCRRELDTVLFADCVVAGTAWQLIDMTALLPRTAPWWVECGFSAAKVNIRIGPIVQFCTSDSPRSFTFRKTSPTSS